MNAADAHRSHRDNNVGVQPGTARSVPAQAYWLISRPANGRIEFFTVDRRKTLPVFSHEEEAGTFLSLWGSGDGWRITESRAGSLVSVLYGPCARAVRVALDPLPEMIPDGTLDFVSLSRECFVDLILPRTWEAARTG